MGERAGIRTIAAAVCGLAFGLLPQSAAGAGGATAAAASATRAYSFAPSSLGGGGFENVIAADPRHNGVLLSGSDVAGIQRSTDYGRTWLPAQHGTITSAYHPVAAIAFDPKSPSDVYAATQAGIAESTNDGASWLPLPLGPNFNGSNMSNPSGTPSAERCVGHLLAVDDTTTPHHLYAASFNQGVWRYDGTAWTLVVSQAQLGGAFCLTSLAWGSGGTLDVATWNAGVFTILAPSGAATVQPVSGAPAVVQELVGLADGDVWGAAHSTGVGLITSAGWTTKLASGGERYMSIDGYVGGAGDVVIAGSDNSQLVSGQTSLHAVLHETSTSGATWTSLPTSTAQVKTELLGPQTGNPWWHGSFAPALLYSQTMVPSSLVIEHKGSGDDLWLAGYGGNWRQLGAEGQTTFYPSDWGLGSTVNHQIALDPTTAGEPRSSQRVYLGDTDWGMLSSADGFSTQQGIADDQFTGAAPVAYGTVVDAAVAPPVVYVGVGNRDSNTHGDVMSAAALAVSTSGFQSLGLATLTGGGRPLALGVVDTSGTPTLIVAVEGSGMWTRVGTDAWNHDTSLFTQDQPPAAAIATGMGAQASTVYAYDRTTGVYRSLAAGAPGTWTLIWQHPSLAAVPFLMVDSSDPTRLWVSAAGGLYRLDGAASTTFGTVSPVIAGVTSGLSERAGQVFTTQLVAGVGLELQVSDSIGTNFTNEADNELSGMLASAGSIAVAGDGVVYIATAGSGLTVGTPVDATTTTLTSTPDPSTHGQRVIFTATVTAANGGDPPAGVVVFWDGTHKLGSSTLSSAGVAAFSSTKLTTGSHSIVARYKGDAVDTPSGSGTIVQTVTV
jgi:hypothetical protein